MIDISDILSPQITNLKLVLDFLISAVGLVLTGNLFAKKINIKFRDSICRLILTLQREIRRNSFKRLRINKFDSKILRILRVVFLSLTIILTYISFNVIHTPKNGSLVTFKKSNINVVLFEDKIESKKISNPIMANWVLTTKDCAKFKDKNQRLDKKIPSSIINDACNLLLDDKLKPEIKKSIQDFQNNKPIIVSILLVMIFSSLWIIYLSVSIHLLNPAIKDFHYSRKIKKISSSIRRSKEKTRAKCNN